MVTTFMMTLNQLKTKFNMCLDGAEDGFEGAWDNENEGGHKFILQNAYEDCDAEMEAFKDAALSEMDSELEDYNKAAVTQKHIAKTDFVNLIKALVIKIHKNPDIPELEKNELKAKILEKRNKFGDDVWDWASELMTLTDDIKTDLENDLNNIINDFEDDVKTDSSDDDIPWLQNYYDETLLEVKDQKTNEKRIGIAQGDEVKVWLQNHVEDLQDALKEICESEHAYHYNPPGFHVDETAIDLDSFKDLSEKFKLITVQLAGTYDTFVEKLMEKMQTFKSEKKVQLTRRREAAEIALSQATNAFGDGIEFVRESIEMKAMNDQDTIMDNATEAREIIEYQLQQNKDNLWRSISYLTKKLYADERNDYNHKVKKQILEKFKELKQFILDASRELHESQSSKWLDFQHAQADYYKFYDKKVIGAKKSLFDVAQHLLLKKLKGLLQHENETGGKKFDEYEDKVFGHLHTNRDIMTVLYNNCISSIDKIDDKYLTTPLVEILNGHKEEADYEFDLREDKFLDDFVVLREWWTNYLESELDAFEEHIVEEAGICDARIESEKQLLIQKTTQMKEEMVDFFDEENALFKNFVDECVNRFKWLLKKYGMGANLP
jgi:hypothetical protein